MAGLDNKRRLRNLFRPNRRRFAHANRQSRKCEHFHHNTVNLGAELRAPTYVAHGAWPDGRKGRACFGTGGWASAPGDNSDVRDPVCSRCRRHGTPFACVVHSEPCFAPVIANERQRGFVDKTGAVREPRPQGRPLADGKTDRSPGRTRIPGVTGCAPARADGSKGNSVRLRSGFQSDLFAIAGKCLSTLHHVRAPLRLSGRA